MTRAVTWLFVLVVCAALSPWCHAGLSAWNSSLIVSGDGLKLLVMLSPDPKYDSKPSATLPDGRLVMLRYVFAKSGLYDASTLQPYWQVDWFSLRADLLWSDDLRYVVRLNRQGFRQNWAIAFYGDGKLLRSYDCAAVLPSLRRDWCLPFETWDWHTRWYDTFDLAADGKTVLLSTARRQMHLMSSDVNLRQQEFYAFDLASGALVGSRTISGWHVWFMWCAGILATGLVCFAWRKGRRRVVGSAPADRFGVESKSSYST